ncbi:MAG: hypothetical protein AB7U46_05405 [Paenirhodobacter sp.]|uniref:hypothetical protein n=1 Tax=Paenirhodobacter sp. TaxID=1965326 RepID=UPI003D0FEEE1
MKTDQVRKGLALGAVALSLAGCMGNGSGGGGGGGGSMSSSDYDTKFAQIENLAPTGNMPTSLKANYTGAAKMDLREGDTGDSIGEVMADLDLDVDWTEGQTNNVWSGQATNFRGTMNGDDFTAEGVLEVDPETSTVGRSESTIALPTGGTQTVASGAMLVHLGGELTVDGTTGQAGMQLGGAFFGDRGRAAIGTAGLGLNTDGDTSPELVGVGTYYLEQ